MTAALFTPPELTFDEPRHRYEFAGREQLSVTTVLRDAGFVNASLFAPADAARGSRVHAAIELQHRGELDPLRDRLDDEAAPFFAAYQSFLMYGNFRVCASEERLCDPALNVAGTLDLRGRFADAGAGALIDVVDIKTGAVPPWVGYQTAGYCRLLPPAVARRCRRWCLQLRADGSFRLLPLTKRSDEQIFLAAVVVAQAKRGWL
jgi:hypothetical protein